MLLTKAEQKQLARRVNALIDLPVIGEGVELLIFEHAVRVVDLAIQQILPNVFSLFLRDPDLGLDPADRERFQSRLLQAINQKVDLPYFDEQQEAQFLQVVIEPLVEAMTRGGQLEGRPLAGPALPEHLTRALAYQDQIEGLVDTASTEAAKMRLQGLAGQVNEWVKAIEELAWRVDEFQQDGLIRQDLQAVPASIQELENRLSTETDPAMRTDLERTLQTRQKQLAALEELQYITNRAEVRIEDSLSSLGTLYSQLLTSRSTDQVADFAALPAELEEETRVLREHLEALREVKLDRLEG